MIEGLTSELIYVYMSIAVSAPLLVGIVSPLISPVMTKLEKKKFERFKEFQEVKGDLNEAESPREYERKKAAEKEAKDEYESAKSKSKYLDGTIYLGGFATLLSLIGSLNLFGIGVTQFGEFALEEEFVVLSLGSFLVEALLLLYLVYFFTQSKREEITEKIE